MLTVTILKGLPASGKTTWAKGMLKEYPGQFKRVNKDDLRAMLDNGKYSRDNEKLVLKLRDTIILKALEDRKHVIVDDTNLHPKHEQQIRELVKGKAEVKIENFEIPLEDAIKRDLQRPVSVGERVIRDMYNNFIKPEAATYKPAKGTPPAYIFDIDGTLAKMTGRSPYDWHRVLEDEPNDAVISILRNLAPHNYIILFSGRDGVCLHDTVEWLRKHGIHYEKLLLRDEGNTEKDAVVKKRMFDTIKDEYHIKGVFDDRNQVVEMWRELGLTCFQVADGDF